MMTSTVKPQLGRKDKKALFELVTLTKIYKVELGIVFHCVLLPSENQQEMTEWIEKLQEAILGQLNSVTSTKELVRYFVVPPNFQNMTFERSPEDDWRIIQKIDECKSEFVSAKE